MSPAMERAAARAVAAASDRLAVALADAVPGATVSVIAGGILMEGRGLGERALVEPALSWPAGVLR